MPRRKLIDGHTEAEWARDAELALRGQYEAVMEVLRRHRLDTDLRVTAWLIAMKVVSVTWRQVKEFAPELAREQPADGPDDGGFYGYAPL